MTERPIKRLGSSSDQTLDRTLAADRPDAGQQSPVEYREVPERRNCDRTLAASDQCSRLQWLGRPDASGQDVISVRSIAEKRDFVPNGYFLSGAYK